MREEIEKAMGQNGHHGDKLLDAKQAAEILCVGEDWLYHHHSTQHLRGVKNGTLRRCGSFGYTMVGLILRM